MGYRPKYCREFGCDFELEWSVAGRGSYFCKDCGRRMIVNRFRAEVSKSERVKINDLLKRDALQPTGRTKKAYFDAYSEQRRFDFNEKINI